MKQTFTLIFAVLLANQVFSQGDRDIKENEVPEKAQKYIVENYPNSKKKKYYKEIEHDSLLYKISFRNKKDQYTLRFLPNGELYEVEKLLKFEELPLSIQQMIKEDLSQRYSSYKIRTTEELNPQNHLFYEITLRGKKQNHSGYFELFYTADGNFVKEKEKMLNSIPTNSGF